MGETGVLKGKRWSGNLGDFIRDHTRKILQFGRDTGHYVFICSRCTRRIESTPYGNLAKWEIAVIDHIRTHPNTKVLIDDSEGRAHYHDQCKRSWEDKVGMIAPRALPGKQYGRKVA